MFRTFKVLIAVAALALAGWFGVHLFARRAGPAFSLTLGEASNNLPDTPAEWQGRIDYRTLDRQFSTLASRPEMAGLAVAIIENGELRFVRGYGVADRATNAPVTADTVFRWASVSKTATGALAASLAKEKAVDLERPISSWPNSLRLPGGAESRLTLAQLLSHQTGLTKNAYDDRLEHGEGPAALRMALAGAPLQCVPGTCHSYQNVAFDAANEILSRAAHKPLPDAVAERFFKPLGMISARYGMAGLAGAKQWARPYAGAHLRPLRDGYWRVPAAAGVESNILDFARWMQAMMGDWPGALPASVLHIAQTPRIQTPRLYSGVLARALSDCRYGLGWRSFTYDGHRLAGHSGAVDGYRATMIFEPATRTGVVAMWNSNWGIPFRIPFAVLDSYHRRAGSPWLDLNDVPLSN